MSAAEAGGDQAEESVASDTGDPTASGGDAAPDPAPAGEGDGAEGAALTVEDLVATLETVTQERDQHLADLQRTAADFQNFRRQTDKRNAEMAAQAGSRVAEALLPVLDACDAAALQGVDGVEPIAAQLTGVLTTSGLEVISDQGEPFDPNRHEAAMSEPGDDGQDVALVAEVLRTGYAWTGRVLRAAMVKVKG
ncbi:MAG: nucleotide exchange factor GrpE [Actinomycetota bacterium]